MIAGLFLAAGLLAPSAARADPAANTVGSSQHPKGLVQYKGRWLKPEEAAWQEQQDRINEDSVPGRPHEEDNRRHDGVPTHVQPAVPTPAPAVPETPAPDTIVLSNGNEMQGVVVKKTKTEVRLQMGPDSFIDLELATVSEIKQGTSKAEAKKLEEWKAQEDVAARQQQRGFHLYEGRWLNDVEYETALLESPPVADKDHGPIRSAAPPDRGVNPNEMPGVR